MKLALEIVVIAMVVVYASSAAWAQPFDPLPTVDLSKFKPSDFTDDELDCPTGGNNTSHGIPYLLAHFKTVADAVSDGSGRWPRGFIGIVVWRGERDNRPHNMRIMENNLALAYFYTTDRPWNVYRGHPALRQRLEAAFEFMLREQNEHGAFSEYEPKRYGLAPTAFATKFLGQSITLLKRPGAPPIDAKLLERVVAMQRKAIMVVLNDPALYVHGRRFTNQFGNVWAGGLAYLDVFPGDAELRRKLEARHASSFKDFFSPAGFPYENDGPDWSYNLGTHASNQRMARFYTRTGDRNPMGEGFVREEQLFFEWMSYNAVPVPDWSGFVLNRAVETRGDVAFRGLAESPFADEVEMIRAFAPTDEEVATRRAKFRKDAEAAWPKVEPLEVGDFRAYPPYDFLHREHHAVHPTAAQRDAARAKLPYLASERFTHQRVDDRRDPPPAYTFVRRPSYYAAFNSGNQKNDQRLGLGLLWHPKLGALIQSQTGSTAHAWGTRLAAADALNAGNVDRGDNDDASHLFEARSIGATFTIDGRPIELETGVRNLPDGDLTTTYSLQYGPGGDGTKRVSFFDDRIEVDVNEDRPFREQIPLLMLPGDHLNTDADSITLRRGTGALRIQPTGATSISRVENEARIGPYRLVSLHLHGKSALRYVIRVDAAGKD